MNELKNTIAPVAIDGQSREKEDSQWRTLIWGGITLLISTIVALVLISCPDNNNNNNVETYSFVCSNGTPAGGSSALANTERCVSCSAGHTLDADLICRREYVFACSGIYNPATTSIVQYDHSAGTCEFKDGTAMSADINDVAYVYYPADQQVQFRIGLGGNAPVSSRGHDQCVLVGAERNPDCRALPSVGVQDDYAIYTLSDNSVVRMDVRAEFNDSLTTSTFQVATVTVRPDTGEDFGQYPYTCANGVPVSGGGRTENIERCAVCNDGYALDNDLSCAAGYAFTCTNGIPARGVSDTENTERCTACASGYDLDANLSCTLASVPSSHTLRFEHLPASTDISIGTKSHGGEEHKIFRDGLGREVFFSGFNVSGKAKHVETGFKPFKNENDAATSFSKLRQKIGSNIVRFTIAWEGVHTGVDTIDTNYLADVVKQIKTAIDNHLYILLDYHTDLYSRHLFNEDSWYTGNGAPAWVLHKGHQSGNELRDYPEENCGVCFTWAQHKLTDTAVRSAAKNFWNNSPFYIGSQRRDTIPITELTASNTRYVQTEFLYQIGKMAEYIKDHLSADEFRYILGVDPYNEPFDGGISEPKFSEEKLWPFYQKVRAQLDANGWEDKLVFAEPLVFWNTSAFTVPATGSHGDPPGAGFVFNAHYYDAARMGHVITRIPNGDYLDNLDEIKQEAKRLDIPPFLSEFGMWLGGSGSQDPVRMINGVYQATEISSRVETNSPYIDFYAPLVSRTQWHWGYYYDNHREYQNGNRNKLITEDDAWNGENFSVISHYATRYNLDKYLLERAYPRRGQGDFLHYYYNAVPTDADGDALRWGSIKVSNGANGAEWFAGNRFLFLAWKGRNSDAPTEIFLPAHFADHDLLIVTENRIIDGRSNLPSVPGQSQDEVVLMPDSGGGGSPSGSRLFVWTDSNRSASAYHFILVVNKNVRINLTDRQLRNMQTNIRHRLQNEKSSVYLGNRW